MNLGMKKAKNYIMQQKKTYLFLIVLTIVSILAGVLFWFIISSEDKVLVKDQLTNFFISIKKGNDINYFSSRVSHLLK